MWHFVSRATGTPSAVVTCMLPRDSSFFCSAGLSPTVRLTRRADIVLVSGRTPFVLKGRDALRRIVQALVRSRVIRGEAPMSVDDLFEAGWPGLLDTLPPASRAQRVYAAVSRLRKLGLHGILENHAQGYRLATSWRVEVDAAQLSLEGSASSAE